MAAKQRKIYHLYDGPKGVTCRSENYSRYSKRVWVVAATSIKQAYYLAGNNKWYKQDNNFVGILAYSPHGSDAKWDRWDGSSEWSVSYEHSKPFNGE